MAKQRNFLGLTWYFKLYEWWKENHAAMVATKLSYPAAAVLAATAISLLL